MYLCLTITGDGIGVHDLSETLGVPAQTVYRKGERFPERKLPRTDIWSFRSDGNDADIARQWASISGLLVGKAGLIRSRVSLGGAVKLESVITLERQIPSFSIPTDMATFASELGTGIDIVFYDMDDEQRPGWEV